MHLATGIFGIPPVVFWPYTAGIILALLGMFAAWREVSDADGLDKVVALGCMCYAIPLAAFGALHLSIPRALAMGVPSWIPARLFWAYFVGFALIASSLSIALKIQVRWSGLMLGIMLFLFVVILHVPRVIANPRDRISWAVALRDLAFAGAGWALAGSQMLVRGTSKLITLGRFVIATAATFFGVEHFLHPERLPGVPLEKLTPAWFPGRVFVGYLTGAVLLAAGVSLLLGRKTRIAASCFGTLILVLVLFIYLPTAIAVPASATVDLKIEASNYLFDTLLFGGAVLVLAGAMPKTDD